MLRSVLHQILSQDHGLYPLFQSYYRDQHQTNKYVQWDLPVLLDILQSLANSDRVMKAYIILDAMDESDSRELEQILDAMAKVCSTQGPGVFKCVLTTRPLGTRHRLETLRLVLEEKNQQSIKSIVDNEISKIIDDIVKEEEDIDVSVFESIKSYIKTNANGVFLWVSMVLKEAKKLSNDGWTKDDLQQLKSLLPLELMELYQRMTKRLTKLPESRLIEGKRILSTAVFSLRRLTLEETRDAILVHPISEVQRYEPDPDCFSKRIEALKRRIPAVCGELIEIKSPFVQLVHESVRDFLFSEKGIADPFSMDKQNGNNDMASICIRYLQLSLGQQILRNYSLSDKSIASWEERDYKIFAELLNERPLLDYCLSFVVEHVRLAEDTSVQSQFQELLRDAEILQPTRNIFHGASIFPTPPPTDDTETASTQQFYARALTIAAKYGYCGAIVPFKTAGADINYLNPDTNTFPLMEATAAGFKNVVEILLKLHVSIDTRDRHGETALHKAAILGRTEIADVLVYNGAVTAVRNKLNQTPLHLAACRGHVDIVKKLAEDKRQLHYGDWYNFTPVHGAVANGQIKVARLLLDLGADPDADAEYHGTPINIAVDKKDLPMVEMLLTHNNGADANFDSQYGADGLHTAAAEGQEDMVSLLLKHGADTNRKDRYGMRPVDWAKKNGHRKLVQMLSEESNGDLQGGSMFEGIENPLEGTIAHPVIWG